MLFRSQPDAAAEAEAVLERLDAARQVQKTLQALKQQASGIVRLIREKNTLEEEIQHLESNLRATGSTKTADGLQAELSQIQIQGYAIFFECAMSTQTRLSSRTLEREKNALIADHDRQLINIRSEENGYYTLQIQEGELRNKVHALENARLRIEVARKEIDEHLIAVKVREYISH